MLYKDAMVAWSAETKEVMVVPWPDRAGLARHLRSSVGAPFASTKTLNLTETVARIFVDFHTLIVRDGINPINAHNEFMNIREYRDHVSPEIEKRLPHPALTRFSESGETG